MPGVTKVRKNRTWLWGWVVVLILLRPVPATGLDGAVDWFKRDLRQALAICNDPEFKNPARAGLQKQQLWQLVDGAFPGEAIIPAILEKTWPALTEAEQDRLRPAVDYAIKWKIIGKLFMFHLEEVGFTSEGVGDRGFVLTGFLGTRLFRHPTRFVFVEGPGRWVAFDVVVDGFSLMEHYRRKFDGTYFSRGLEGLLRQLAQEVNDDFREMGYRPPGGPFSGLENGPEPVRGSMNQAVFE